VEARNTQTAQDLDRLGLPEFYAMEAFVVRRADNGVDTREVEAIADLMPAHL
jgi:hypothetical protein